MGSRVTAGVMAAALLAGAACSSGDDGASGTTAIPVRTLSETVETTAPTTVSETTIVETTTPATTAQSTATPTTLEPPTTTVEPRLAGEFIGTVVEPGSVEEAVQGSVESLFFAEQECFADIANCDVALFEPFVQPTSNLSVTYQAYAMGGEQSVSENWESNRWVVASIELTDETTAVVTSCWSSAQTLTAGPIEYRLGDLASNDGDTRVWTLVDGAWLMGDVTDAGRAAFGDQCV